MHSARTNPSYVDNSSDISRLQFGLLKFIVHMVDGACDVILALCCVRIVLQNHALPTVTITITKKRTKPNMSTTIAKLPKSDFAHL